MTRFGVLGAALVTALLACPTTGAGQDASPPDSDPADTLAVSPGGAFVRSLLVPGWGQAAVGAYGRGGFYFATTGATAWMLAKTAHFLGAAEDRRAMVRRQVVEELARRGVTDPDSVAPRLEDDERMEAAEDLVEVRSQQMEDWTAFGVFWLFLNAADAFVSAHLRDFPEPIEVDASPTGGPGGIGARLRVSIPVGPRRHR